MTALIIVGVVVLLLVIFIGANYNSLVKLRNQVKEAFSTMDVYLKKRWDLIPNVVETVKGYAKHEKEVLEEVISLRNGTYDKMSNAEKADADAKISQGLGRLLAIAENYPELKANENFMRLNDELSKVEDDIAFSRKYYNACVREFNNKVQMFPSSIIAGMFHFKEEKMFEIAESEKENVKVEF